MPTGRIQQAQIVVNLSDCAYGGARAAAGSLLLDGDGGAEAVDGVHVGPFHLVKKLPGVGGERFHVAALAFGIDGVEGERDLPEPDSPVITVRVLRGISTEMFLRLCWRAPRTVMLLMAIENRFPGTERTLPAMNRPKWYRKVWEGKRTALLRSLCCGGETVNCCNEVKGCP